MPAPLKPVGALLRDWRQRRRLSQLDLALEAQVSTRHLSFVESGRAKPSREMVLHLAERLGVPLRERNLLLVAAGFAPVFAERSLDDPALTAAREAIDLILKGHEPYPALAIDRHWTMVANNAASRRLLGGVDPELLRPPVNVLRLSLHPAGLSRRIANLSEWRAHLLERLRRQIDTSADPVLVGLLTELQAYPADGSSRPTAAAPSLSPASSAAGIVVPLQLVSDAGTLTLLSTTTVFGTPLDVTLSELALECFYPADAATAEQLRSLAGERDPDGK